MRFFLRRWPGSRWVALAACCLSFQAIFGQLPRGLFSEDTSSMGALRFADVDDSAQRSRLVEIDPAVLPVRGGNELSVRLNLFAGIEPLVTLRATETGDEAYSVFTGTIVHEAGSQVILVKRGEMFAGSVLIPGRAQYQIVPKGNRISLLEQSALPTQPLCGRSPHPALQENIVRSSRSELAAQYDFQNSGGYRAAAAAEDGSNEAREIEVMIVYTASAKEAVSSAGGIEAVARLSIEEANAALANSDTGVRFRIVHIAEVEYEETGDLAIDLDKLRSTSDGVMDDVHALRDEYQADLVALLVGHSHTFGGLAHSAGGPEDGFSVIHVQLPSLVAHELGHNLGCDHDWENSSGSGAFSFSHGHRFNADGVTYCTVMSYAPGWPIPHYSNPNVAFRGAPTGRPEGEIDEADNARTIRALAPFVDSYRGVTVDLSQVSESTSSDQPIQLSASVQSDEGPVLSVEFYAGELLLGEATAPPYNFTWAEPPPGRHFLSARARISGGIVGYSKSVVVAVGPVNDHFANRLKVSGSNVVASTVLYAATAEPGEPASVGNAGVTTWWGWNTPVDGIVRVSVSGANSARARVAVFAGGTLENLTAVDPTAPLSADVFFQATANDEYQICLVGEPTAEMLSLYITMQAPPPNDAFAKAEKVNFLSGLIRGSTVAASAEAGEPLIGSRAWGHSIWFAWSPSSSGVATLNFASTSRDTDFAIFTDTNLSALKLVASSAVARQGFSVQAGETYRIVVDGPFGAISLALNLITPPANDNFSNRATLQPGGAYLMIMPATREPNEPSHGTTQGGNSQWWSWRAPSNGGVRVTRPLRPGTYPNLSVAWYTGTALTNLVKVASFDFTNNMLTESFIVPVRGLANYMIAVESSGTVSQPVRFEFRGAAVNDNFRQAQALGTNRILGTTLGTTAERGEPAHGDAAAEHSIWWSWLSLTNREMSISVDCAGDALPRVAVYTGTILSNLTLITDNVVNGVIAPTITFHAEAGGRYRIAVDEAQSSFNYSLHLKAASQPTNDLFQTAQLLPASPQLFPGSTIGASLEPGEPEHSPDGGCVASVWYDWTPGSDVDVAVLAGGRRANELDMRAVFPEPVVAIYQGTNLASLALVQAGIGSANFRPLRGDKYYIAVATIAGQQDFYLSILPPPQNDRFDRAQLLSPVGTSATFPLSAGSPTSLRAATIQPGEPRHSDQASGHSLWWTWVPNRSGEYLWSTREQFTTLNTQPTALVMAVYSGTQLTNLVTVASTLSESLNFSVQAGRRYYLVLDLQDPRVLLSRTSFGGLGLSLTRYPTLLQPRLRSGFGMEFVIIGSTGQTVALEISNDLVNWELLRQTILQASEYKYLEPDWAQFERRFLRAVLK